MIELINDDYADFVNLSSNLVGLKETIDKLTKDIEVIFYLIQKGIFSGSFHYFLLSLVSFFLFE